MALTEVTRQEAIMLALEDIDVTVAIKSVDINSLDLASIKAGDFIFLANRLPKEQKPKREPLDYEKVRKMYLENKKSPVAIGKEFGYTTEEVQGFLRKNGLEQKSNKSTYLG